MRLAPIFVLFLGVVGCGGNVVVDAASTTTSSTTSGTGGSSTQCTGARVPENHRASGPPCPGGRAPGMKFPPGTPACMTGQGCQSDADCTAGTNGRCADRGFGALCSLCSYDACSADADCGSGVPCDCRASAADATPNTCAAGGQCRVDADCGPCGYCSPSTPSGSICSGHPIAYFCHTPSDTCVDDADCASQAKVCSFDATAGHWACANGCVQPP